MPFFYVRCNDTTKKVSAVSLAELKSRSQVAFKVTISRISVQEDVKIRGQTQTIDVDIDSEEHFATLEPDQLLDAYVAAPTPASIATMASTSVAGATIAISSGEVVSAPKGMDAPLVSLAKFEYADGESYNGWFFEGYSSAAVHHTMLKDHYRTLSYVAAMEAHADQIKGKVVIDVGTGSGIWAMTAARLGAKRVIGIEAGAMATTARANVERNGLAHIVDILHGTVEEFVEAGVRFENPDGTGRIIVGDGTGLQVDVIVSEWMGYWLLTEGVLRSVFAARDAWMPKDATGAPSGVMLPSHCAMYIAPFEDIKFGNFWNDVYGLDMANLEEFQGRRDIRRKFPSVEVIDKDHLIAPPAVCRWVDCRLDSVESITNFDDKWRCEVVPEGLPFTPASPPTVAGHARYAAPVRTCHGFVGTFSVFFDGRAGGRRTFKELRALADEDKIVELCSLPPATKSRDTHWYHSVLLMEPFELKVGDAIEGTLSWAPNKDEARYYDARIEWSVNGGAQRSRFYEKC